MLGFTYSMVGNGADYLVDHSTQLILISPEMERVAIIKPQVLIGQSQPQLNSEMIISDIKKIIKNEQVPYAFAHYLDF